MPPRNFRDPQGLPAVSAVPLRQPALRRFTRIPRRTPSQSQIPNAPVPPPTYDSQHQPIVDKARAFSELLDTSKLELTRDEPLTVHKRKIRIPKRFVQGLVLVIVLGGLWFVYGFHKLKLTEFSADNFSLNVPSKYEQAQTLGLTTFKERGGDESKRSMVFVLEPTSRTGLNTDFSNNAAIAANFSLVERTLPTTLESYIGQSSSIEQVQIDKVSHDGDSAFLMHGNVLLSGKKSGVVSALVVYHNSGIYTVVVYANDSDKDLGKASKHVLDTFNIHSSDPNFNTP